MRKELLFLYKKVAFMGTEKREIFVSFFSLLGVMAQLIVIGQIILNLMNLT
jgi:hypothetical protein